MSSGLLGFTVVAAAGAGCMAGVFFAFSAFVMRGLGRLPAAEGVAAMQSINVTAVRPPFMVGLFGTAAVCVVLAGWAVLTWSGRQSALVLAGSLLYLVGAIVLTVTYHVPLNDKLAAVDPNSAGAAAHWADYARTWTRWNHVRAAAALAAAATFTLALAV